MTEPWYRYSLRTLMLGICLVSVTVAFLCAKAKRAHDQRRAVAAIQKVGGDAYYDYHRDDSTGRVSLKRSPVGLKWARKVLGDDFFSPVVMVEFRAYSQVNDRDLHHLQSLADLEVLNVFSPNVCGHGLVSVKELPRLRILNLGRTKASNDDLVHLAELDNLESLNLGGTMITDAGLQHLRGLTSLRRLTLASTKIEGDGLAHLLVLSNLEELNLANTSVTDGQLAHLAGLTGLHTLDLRGTLVSDTGLRHLTNVPSLQRVFLQRTSVSSSALEKFREAVPTLSIWR